MLVFRREIVRKTLPVAAAQAMVSSRRAAAGSEQCLRSSRKPATARSASGLPAKCARSWASAADGSSRSSLPRPDRRTCRCGRPVDVVIATKRGRFVDGRCCAPLAEGSNGRQSRGGSPGRPGPAAHDERDRSGAASARFPARHACRDAATGTGQRKRDGEKASGFSARARTRWWAARAIAAPRQSCSLRLSSGCSRCTYRLAGCRKAPEVAMWR